MAAPRRRDPEQDDESSGPDPATPEMELSVHATSPERTVFTEPGNSEGWISTDLTVDIER